MKKELYSYNPLNKGLRERRLKRLMTGAIGCVAAVSRILAHAVDCQDREIAHIVGWSVDHHKGMRRICTDQNEVITAQIKRLQKHGL